MTQGEKGTAKKGRTGDRRVKKRKVRGGKEKERMTRERKRKK